MIRFGVLVIGICLWITGYHGRGALGMVFGTSI